jgi:thioesterase domain-containing protein/acyl carrier protein
VIVGGERLLAEPLQRWRRTVGPGVRLWNSYGPTETTVTATGAVLGGNTELTIGRPDSGVRVFVVDGAFQPQPVGTTGELIIGGGSVARGYLGRPRLTAERFAPDPWGGKVGARLYRSGDRVRRLADGRLDFQGRLDAQLKIRGFRVEPGEIEDALRHHSGVAEAVVVAFEEDAGDLRLVAHVVPAEPAAENTAENTTEIKAWRQFLTERLPAWAVPSHFVLHAELPRLTSGKIDRSTLARQRGAVAPVPEGDALTEVTATEQFLIDLWGQLLGVTVTGRDQDFFALGGHSLLATKLVARIRHLCGVELPLREIFEYRTLGALARRLEEREASREVATTGPPWIEIQPTGPRPPMFWVHPVGGTVFCYLELSKSLGSQQPFFAFQAPGVEPGEKPLASIEALATQYVDALIAEGFEAPLTLGGWSLGGVVAYEMARRLEKAGRPVERVILVDSHLPDRSAGMPGPAELLLGFARELRIPPEALAEVFAGGDVDIPQDSDDLGAAASATIERIFETARAAGALSPEFSRDDLHRLLAVYTAHVKALQTFVPRPYQGPVSLFLATHGASANAESANAESAGAWAALLGELEIHHLEGEHYTLLAEPRVRSLAEQIELSSTARTAQEIGTS